MGVRHEQNTPELPPLQADVTAAEAERTLISHEQQVPHFTGVSRPSITCWPLANYVYIS